MKTPEDILAHEFSEAFVKGMKDRMLVSYYKYGRVQDAYPYNVNAIKSLQVRLEKYAETGNTEYLMDVANFAMIEFMLPAHPEAHYKATDADGSPGRVSKTRGDVTQDDNKAIGMTRIEKAKLERERRLGLASF